MEELRYVTYAAVFICILLVYIDNVSTRRNELSRIGNLGNFLFKTKRQTIVIFFITFVGILIYPLSFILPEIFTNFVAVIVFCFMIGIAIIVAIGYGRIREMKLKEPRPVLTSNPEDIPE